jgi:hypothetical protein
MAWISGISEARNIHDGDIKANSCRECRSDDGISLIADMSVGVAAGAGAAPARRFRALSLPNS